MIPFSREVVMADGGRYEFSGGHRDGRSERTETRSAQSPRYQEGCFRREQEHGSSDPHQHIEACEGQLQLGLSPYMAEDYGAGREERCVGAPSSLWSVFHDVRFDGLEDVVRRCRLLAAAFPEPFVLGWIMEEFSQSHPDLIRSVVRGFYEGGSAAPVVGVRPERWVLLSGTLTLSGRRAWTPLPCPSWPHTETLSFHQFVSEGDLLCREEEVETSSILRCSRTDTLIVKALDYKPHKRRHKYKPILHS